MRRNPLNEEWAGSPKRSVYGQAMRNALTKLVHSAPPVIARNVRDGARGFRDTFGHVVNRVPIAAPLARRRDGYAGQIPLAAMPLIKKPKPWEVG